MGKYLVRKTYKYTEDVEVEAKSRGEACDKAQEAEGDRNHDDYLYNCEVVKELEVRP